jgi:transcriptional regulator with GAF, ATPase, and Fis domain
VGSATFDDSVARIGSETTVRGLLGGTCRELVELLNATACAVSRVVGDLLIGLDEYTLASRPLEHGHEFLIPDYPLTREVVESGEPRRVSRLDPDAERTETALLEKLGYDTLLMVCLPSAGECWGLIEVYGDERGFDEEQIEVARRVARVAGERLNQLDSRR